MTLASLIFIQQFGTWLRHSSSEQIHKKWANIGDKKHSLKNITNNDLKVPEKPS